MSLRKIEIDGLFQSVGLATTGAVLFNENTYDFDPAHPEDNWLYGTFLGFKKLRAQGFTAETFGTIGTGSGVDSIGANEIFGLKKVFQTDIHPNVISIAQKNVLDFVDKTIDVKTYLGDLCAPLIDQNIRVDLLYANIPNIPSEQPILNGKVSASRFQKQTSEDCPPIFEKWFLSLQYRFLKQAKDILSETGVILVAIGDRVPGFVFQKLFSSTGYKSAELVTLYKIQTEPEEVVAGYAEQEIQENIEFDFYDHENALPVWQNFCKGKNMSVEEIKEFLQPFRISAFEALRQFRRKGRSVGHVYSIYKLSI